MKSNAEMSSHPLPGFAALGFAIALAMASGSVAAASGASEGTVFSLSNASSGNRVLVYERMADGSLEPGLSVPTGGNGTSSGLGNQGALALSDSGRWLLAVNPGSNSVSVFRVRGSRLVLTDVEPSLGAQPVSVTVEGNLVYVLNAGSDDIRGFRLNPTGRLIPIPHSRRALSASGAGAAQVSLSRDASVLAVTEKATNRVVTFKVHADGRLGDANIQASPTPTPFGFDFGPYNRIFVSEAAGGAAGASTLTSWQIHPDGHAVPISAAVPSLQSAACWVVVTRDGQFAYVANTGSDNVSTYAIADNGAVGVVDAIAGQTGAGSAPTDLALGGDDEFLYALNPGNDTISAFRVDADGVLHLVEHQATGSADGRVTGLVAR